MYTTSLSSEGHPDDNGVLTYDRLKTIIQRLEPIPPRLEDCDMYYLYRRRTLATVLLVITDSTTHRKLLPVWLLGVDVAFQFLLVDKRLLRLSLNRREVGWWF